MILNLNHIKITWGIKNNKTKILTKQQNHGRVPLQSNFAEFLEVESREL